MPSYASSSRVKERREQTRAGQVGFLMKTYRESFEKDDGRVGLSQTELLHRMGEINPQYKSIRSHGTVSRWETGESIPTAERIETYGKALNLSEHEIDGLILLAGLSPGFQNSRTLTCTRCGGETVTEQVNNERTQTCSGLAVTKAMRVRRCLDCGHSEESCEHWASRQTAEQVIEDVEGAAAWIRQTLREAETLRADQVGEEAPEGSGGPNFGEEATIDQKRE